MEGILAGLTHAENKGVVHRALKPENLMVTDDGWVKITDFGIAKATVTSGLGTFLTKDGMTVGRPSYMSPEQAVASKNIGLWTDLYSVGVMAYEHLTGRPPFCDAAGAIILFRHVSEPIQPAIDDNRDVDRELFEWVDRLLAKDPRERTRSPVVAWEQLEDIGSRRTGALWRLGAAAESYAPPKHVSPSHPRPLRESQHAGVRSGRAALGRRSRHRLSHLWPRRVSAACPFAQDPTPSGVRSGDSPVC
ncbi:MAG: serine/threonine protein kinase [Solirubrobacterales bacterium]|nr:serine/threonine protein kinase [Solirubrobacterales bacterium]